MVWRCVLLACVLINMVQLGMNEIVRFGVLREQSFYFPTSLKVSWHKAFELCRSQGMFLVTIQNRAKLDAVIEHIEQSEDWKAEGVSSVTLWTAFNDIGEEGQFYSASTGKQLQYANWREGEPNNFNEGGCMFEDCIALVHFPNSNITYSFDDRPCNHKFTFLCEPPQSAN